MNLEVASSLIWKAGAVAGCHSGLLLAPPATFGIKAMMSIVEEEGPHSQ